MTMLSDRQIDGAKKRVTYSSESKPYHEHHDDVRIAYEWLDAQARTKGTTRSARPLKHHIERWGGRYVSRSDVDVAAELHPDIRGAYPCFNISKRLILPSGTRLAGIGEAKTRSYELTPQMAKEIYTRTEDQQA
jgi:hypothetical protein